VQSQIVGHEQRLSENVGPFSGDFAELRLQGFTLGAGDSRNDVASAPFRPQAPPPSLRVLADERIEQRGRLMCQEYNEARPRQGRWCFGKTPMQTFVDAMPMAKEKMIAA